MSTRKEIVKLYKARGKCLRLSDVAVELGFSFEKLALSIGSEDRLDDLCGISVVQASELIQFYGSRFLFSEKVQQHIDDFLTVRKRLDSIEARARKTDPKPSGDEQ